MNWQTRALRSLRLALEGFEANEEWQSIMVEAYHRNRWFEMAQVQQSLKQWRDSLTDDFIAAWLERYNLPIELHDKKLGVIMAGNIPLVGMHDLIVGVLAGYKVVAKKSSDDAVLPSFWLSQAAKYDTIWIQRVEFADQLRNLDVAIATGSNNSARYFSSFFQKIPHIIRNNRNSLAILSGNETVDDFISLGRDVFDYFGLGCRNVTHLMMPKGYDVTPLFQCWDEHYYQVGNHNKYANNYEYHRALFLLNLDPHIDTGYLIAKEKSELYAPVGMLNYSFYEEWDTVKRQIEFWKNDLQCIVSQLPIEGAMNFGLTQRTQLTDFSDGIDTLGWLLSV